MTENSLKLSEIYRQKHWGSDLTQSHHVLPVEKLLFVCYTITHRGIFAGDAYKDDLEMIV